MNKHTRVWSLQDAKARLSEVVRLALSEGPQIVTVHGREAIMIVPIASQTATDRETGATLVDLLNRSPLRAAQDLDFERIRLRVKGRKSGP